MQKRTLYYYSITLLLMYNSICMAGGIYQVKDYGINPNGELIADKLSKLTSLVSKQGGGIIQFESGTYIMGSGLSKNGEPYGNVRLYPNVTYKGKEGTVLKANSTGCGFHSMFGTSDNSVTNVIFEDITFDTYIGSRNRDFNDYRLAIALHWGKNYIIRRCRFIHDIGTIDTRYSHKQEDKDAGLYRIDGLIIEDCSFEAKVLSDTGYRDITILGICAQNVIVRNNSFCVLEKIKKNANKYYPNCCLEIQGKDMWIYGNEFKDYTNAIDYTTTDNYSENRNINIYNNKILNYRGIALWCRPNQSASGITIQKNLFKLACDNPDKRVTGVKGAIVLVSHPNESTDGIFSNINITNNVFDYSGEQSFYTKLTYKDWIKVPQNKTNERYGMTFTEFYSAIDLGGSSSYRDNILIQDNRFDGCCFPCIYVGGKNVSRNHLIRGNVFNECSIKGNYYIITITNHCENFYIGNNLLVDNSFHRKGSIKGKFFQAKWSGLKKEGYADENGLQFDNIVLLKNQTVSGNGELIDAVLESDFSNLSIKNNCVF